MLPGIPESMHTLIIPFGASSTKPCFPEGITLIGEAFLGQHCRALELSRPRFDADYGSE